jgi:C-terminal processing protease CtpA/Prc
MGRAPGDLSIQDDHAPVIERLAQGIAYARLPSFNPSNYGQAPEGAWPKRQPDDHVLIVDLRNNEGGAYYYGVSMLQGWVSDGEMISVGQIGSELNASCLYPALRWNSGFGGEPQMILDAMARPYPPGCPRAVTRRPAQWTWRQHRFSPKPDDLRVVAVVNSRCASDCELMTELLASRSATLIVGSNTFGVAQFIQPGYSTLPSTGIDYRIALGTSNIYGDNRSFDGYGLDVDVVVPEVDSLRPDQLLKLAQIVMKLPAAE